jgi:hypothetical protein
MGPWDNVFTSPKGPPPGYVPGGPNKSFSITTISPPAGQPAQKSYKEWNTGWNGTANENSWEITEPAIYTQGAYISLLVRVIGNSGGQMTPATEATPLPAEETHGIPTRVYPVPASNKITITGYHSREGVLIAKFFDTNGRLLLTEEWKEAEGYFSKTISIANLARGIYWLKISGSETTLIKVIKQ